MESMVLLLMETMTTGQKLPRSSIKIVPTKITETIRTTPKETNQSSVRHLSHMRTTVEATELSRTKPESSKPD